MLFQYNIYDFKYILRFHYMKHIILHLRIPLARFNCRPHLSGCRMLCVAKETENSICGLVITIIDSLEGRTDGSDSRGADR